MVVWLLEKGSYWS